MIVLQIRLRHAHQRIGALCLHIGRIQLSPRFRGSAFVLLSPRFHGSVLLGRLASPGVERREHRLPHDVGLLGGQLQIDPHHPTGRLTATQESTHVQVRLLGIDPRSPICSRQTIHLRRGRVHRNIAKCLLGLGRRGPGDRADLK